MPKQSIVGIVQARNERGVRVEGQWWNVSSFRAVSLDDIEPGATVKLVASVNPERGTRYLDSIERVGVREYDQAVEELVQRLPAPSMNGHAPEAPAWEPEPPAWPDEAAAAAPVQRKRADQAARRAAISGRDTDTATRLAVLQAAAEYGWRLGDSDDAVLVRAAKWLAWVRDDELCDAF